MNNKLQRILTLLLAAAMLLSLGACAANPNGSGTEVSQTAMPDPVDDNYRSFYQIFVGSYSDSNNDGIGDLRGVINRFDYLNDGNMLSEESLGVQGIWLSPIFASPSYHKYDASDYYRVDPLFGTEEDLKELAALCEERNVKLILDLVLNHTSSRHEWFLQFKKARAEGDTQNPYYNYYSCVAETDKTVGIVYQQIAGTDCWYECNFSGDMPELNFDNPEVRQAMLDVAKYYLDLGVDGFRFDAVKYIYYNDTAKSVAFWEWYMEELRKINPEIYCVGECWSGDLDVLEYYSAMNCFNFSMAQVDGVIAKTAKGASISKYTNYLQTFQTMMLEKNPEGMVMPFLSNHDMDRIAGALVKDDNIRMAANLYLLCSGSPTIYYGEEIGIRGSRGGDKTDANRRLAMLWGDDDTIRNPEGATYPEKNQIQTTVADQMADENSLCRYYCRLLTLRHRYPAIPRGLYTALDCGEEKFGGFLITYGEETLGLLHNTSTEEITYDLSSLEGCGFSELCDYIGVGNAALEGTVLTVGPQTSVIVR